jgi:hypothetical protein
LHFFSAFSGRAAARPPAERAFSSLDFPIATAMLIAFGWPKGRASRRQRPAHDTSLSVRGVSAYFSTFFF